MAEVVVTTVSSSPSWTQLIAAGTAEDFTMQVFGGKVELNTKATAPADGTNGLEIYPSDPYRFVIHEATDAVWVRKAGADTIVVRHWINPS
jgi:hypothetical protein